MTSLLARVCRPCSYIIESDSSRASHLNSARDLSIYAHGKLLWPKRLPSGSGAGCDRRAMVAAHPARLVPEGALAIPAARGGIGGRGTQHPLGAAQGAR